MEEDSVDNIRTLFAFETQTLGSTSFPSACHDKYIATKTFTTRAQQVGDRLKNFLDQEGIQSSGALDFSKGGCYKLEFGQDGKCTNVVHCTGAKVQMPSHVVITTEFSLIDNHLDHLARVELLPCNYLLYEFFVAKKPGVLEHMIKDKKGDSLRKMAKAIAEKHAEGETQIEQQTVKEDKALLSVVAKKKAAANLLKARSKLEEKKKDRAARRTIKLA